MKTKRTLSLIFIATLCSVARAGEPQPGSTSGTRQNNLVTTLLEATSIQPPGRTLSFTRKYAGWIFVSATTSGAGEVRVVLDPSAPHAAKLLDSTEAHDKSPAEAMRFVTQGPHHLAVECDGTAAVDRLIVKAIPELIHSGLGYDPAIKSYGHYDWKFLAKDILPNITTLIVPSNIKLQPAEIANWHRQGKRFVAEVGVDEKAKSSAEHVENWAGAAARLPFLDGVIIDEFIINNPSPPRRSPLSPERQKRLDAAHARHRLFAEAMKKLKSDPRFAGKMLYAYFGGSGKTLNQEIIGKDFVHSILDLGYRVVPERYIFEVSSEDKAKAALKMFVDGIADWEAKEPGVRRQMVIAFGLFSMPPGGINKLPNVDYHVWMDQQMNAAANHPSLEGLDGLNWWTTLLTDEETVRFVGKLYRHYAIEGKMDLLTHDPLFLTHIQNADFEKGLDAWTLQSAEPGSIQAKRFPRYGRIEGRYMGLGRPADPEHIGDTFLLMKRSPKGPNTFSQTIKNLEPGRLYSMKMFSCDYQDLIHPQKKTQEQAHKFVGSARIEGVELDEKRSFTEMYPSGPEPPIPVWITYFWMVFRAKSPTATVIVSDWPATADKQHAADFGREQTFNFVEIEPYHE